MEGCISVGLKEGDELAFVFDIEEKEDYVDVTVEAMTSKIILMMPKNQELRKFQRFKNQVSRIKIRDSRIKIQG